MEHACPGSCTKYGDRKEVVSRRRVGGVGGSGSGRDSSGSGSGRGMSGSGRKSGSGGAPARGVIKDPQGGRRSSWVGRGVGVGVGVEVGVGVGVDVGVGVRRARACGCDE